MTESISTQLPIKRNLSLAFVLSFLVTALMTAVSLGGLLFPSLIYPSDELRQAFLANDLANFLVGIPILLACMWLTKRGKLIGLLCWPGALLYTFYNYIAYVVGMPFNWITPGFILLVLLSATSIFVLVQSIEWDSVKTKLTGKVSGKFSGGVLVFFGVAFFFLAVGVITGASSDQTTISMTDVGVAIADIVLSALLVLGGILLFQRKPLGYAGGMGLLFAASALFIGVILVVLLQPLLTSAPFVLEDLIVLLGMALVCFIPTGLFMRAVLSNS
ncbi:MAG: hypothetical protein AB8I58_00500 [Anaerolineales bacterium]